MSTTVDVRRLKVKKNIAATCFRCQETIFRLWLKRDTVGNAL